MVFTVFFLIAWITNFLFARAINHLRSKKFRDNFYSEFKLTKTGEIEYINKLSKSECDREISKLKCWLVDYTLFIRNWNYIGELLVLLFANTFFKIVSRDFHFITIIFVIFSFVYSLIVWNSRITEFKIWTELLSKYLPNMIKVCELKNPDSINVDEAGIPTKA
jgi:hypothetical protein